MTNDIMTIDSLIAKLIKLREKHGGDVVVTVDNDFGESLNERNLAHDSIVSLEWKQL